MFKGIDKDNLDQMATKANELFEGVEIKEEDFEEKFDNHLPQTMKDTKLLSNKDTLLDMAEGCSKYLPCPLCYKCRNKGSHLYVKCDSCLIPICVHTDSQINMLIRRDNFTQEVSKEMVDFLKKEELIIGGKDGSV